MYQKAFLAKVALVCAMGSTLVTVGATPLNLTNVDEPGIARRSLATGSFTYTFVPSACALKDGHISVSLTAHATTGNSYEDTLYYDAYAFPTGFDNSLHCDSSGVICWSGVSTSSTTGNVCVHYANTYSCGDFTTSTTMPFGSGNCNLGLDIGPVTV